MVRSESVSIERSTTVARWPLVAIALVCGGMAAAYGFVGVMPDPLLMWGLFLVPLLVVAQWIQQDARLRHAGLLFDWGFIGYVTWPIFLPWYAFRTRGRAGWRLMAGLFLTVLAAQLGFTLGRLVGDAWFSGA